MGKERMKSLGKPRYLSAYKLHSSFQEFTIHLIHNIQFLDLMKYLIISTNQEKENLRRSVKYYDPSIPTHLLTGYVNKANVLW